MSQLPSLSIAVEEKSSECIAAVKNMSFRCCLSSSIGHFSLSFNFNVVFWVASRVNSILVIQFATGGHQTVKKSQFLIDFITMNFIAAFPSVAWIFLSSKELTHVNKSHMCGKIVKKYNKIWLFFKPMHPVKKWYHPDTLNFILCCSLFASSKLQVTKVNWEF